MARFGALAAWSLSVGVLSHQTAPLDTQQAVITLNDAFRNDSPSRGVVMRQTSEFKMYCGGACFKGHPDCILSAFWWNEGIALDKQSNFLGDYTYQAKWGVVFNSTVVQREIAKCYYIYDGNSDSRYNGGCGCWAPTAARWDCSDPQSPYNNIGIDEKFVFGDSPEAMQCHCKDDAEKPSLMGCFWRGPAYPTSKGNFFNGSELEQFYRQKQRFPIGSYDDQNWDEVVLDVNRLQAAIDRDPAGVLLAVFFFANDVKEDRHWDPNPSKHYEGAQSLQRQIKASTGIALPIVGMKRVNISRRFGPFYEHKPASEPVVI